LEELEKNAKVPAETLDAFKKALDDVITGPPAFPPPPKMPETLEGIRNSALLVMTMMQESDDAPTSGMMASAAEIHAAAPKALAHWKAFQQQELPKFNDQLKQLDLPPLKLAQPTEDVEVDMSGNDE